MNYIVTTEKGYRITTTFPLVPEELIATCHHLTKAKIVCDALNAIKNTGNPCKTEANWYQQGYDAREKELPSQNEIRKILEYKLCDEYNFMSKNCLYELEDFTHAIRHLIEGKK